MVCADQFVYQSGDKPYIVNVLLVCFVRIGEVGSAIVPIVAYSVEIGDGKVLFVGEAVEFATGEADHTLACAMATVQNDDEGKQGFVVGSWWKVKEIGSLDAVV